MIFFLAGMVMIRWIELVGKNYGAMIYVIYFNLILYTSFYMMNNSVLLDIIGIKKGVFSVFLMVAFSLFVHLTFLIIFFIIGVLFQRLFAMIFTSKRKIVLYGVFGVLNVVYAAFLFFDMKLYKTLGVHLHNFFIVMVIENGTFEHASDIKNQNYFEAGLTVFLIILIQLVLFLGGYLLRKTVRKYVTIAPLFLWGIVAIFVGKYTIDHPIADTIPFYEVLRNYDTNTQIQANYPQMPANMNLIKKPKNVLFLLVETFRGDTIGTELTPHIVGFQKNHQCILSQNHFPGAHSTAASLFSLLYGLNGYLYLPFLREQKIKSLPLALLKESGYQVDAVSTSALNKYKDSKFLTQQYDHYKLFTGEEEKDDYHMVQWLKDHYLKRDKTKPFFYFAFFYSPHFGYYSSKEFQKYKPVLDLHNKDFAISADDMGVEYKQKLRNRYYNSILYTDHLINELFTTFKESIDSGELIIVVTGDHGEEFWEHGGFGHVRPKFVQEKIKVPLLFCLPGMKHTEHQITSHMDIFPTIFDYLGVNIDLKKYFDGISLLKQKREYAPISSFYFPSPGNLIALVNRMGKIVIQQKSKSFKPKDNFWIKKQSTLDDKPLSTIPGSLQNALKRFHHDYIRFLKVSEN